MRPNRHPNRRDVQRALGAALLVPLWPTARAQTTRPAACPPLLAHRFPRLQDEALQDLCQYAGQVLLAVLFYIDGKSPQIETCERRRIGLKCWK